MKMKCTRSETEAGRGVRGVPRFTAQRWLPHLRWPGAAARAKTQTK